MQNALSPLFLALCSSPSAQLYGDLGLYQQRIWIVDETGAGDFTELQDAVDAARSGDWIRVRAGQYGGFEIDGLGLTIVGEPGVEIRRSAVRNLPAASSVLLRDLTMTFQHGPFTAPPPLSLSNNRGSVWVEDCAITIWGALTPPALEIVDSDAVILVRTAVQVLYSNDFLGSNYIHPCASVLRSDVHAFECTFHGAGGSAGVASHSDGASGMEVQSGFLFASGCTFEGGPGANSGCIGSMSLGGTDGGDGLVLLGSTEAHAIGCSFSGGAGGSAMGTGLCSQATGGVAGDPGQGVVGPIELLSGSARSYALDPGAPSGPPLLTATGAPGDLVLSIFAVRPGELYLPAHQGTQILAPPFAFRVEGTIPSSGTLVLPSPPLFAATAPYAFRVEYRQGFFFPAGGEALLGSGSTGVVLPD